MRNLSRALVAATLVIAAGLRAADLSQVDSMNYPAWLLRDGATLALRPDAELADGDLIRTGEDGRVLLRLADGSAVKLGQGAEFRIATVAMREEAGTSLLDATLEVLRGAFRLTSAFFGDAATRHRVNVRIGAITAGIRGTDIWGRSNLEEDLVCLIEGSIRVETADRAPLDMADALTFYRKPKDQPPRPVVPVDPVMLEGWALETELLEANGIAAADGRWRLVLQSFSRADLADRALREFHARGFAAEKIEMVDRGRTLNRLVLPGFISADAARKARDLVRRRLGIDDSWIWRAQ